MIKIKDQQWGSMWVPLLPYNSKILLWEKFKFQIEYFSKVVLVKRNWCNKKVYVMRFYNTSLLNNIHENFHHSDWPLKISVYFCGQHLDQECFMYEKSRSYLRKNFTTADKVSPCKHFHIVLRSSLEIKADLWNLYGNNEV